MLADFQNDSPSDADWARALVRVGQDEQLLFDLAGFYLEDAPQLLRELDAAFQAQDVEAATRTAHSLKGLAANFDAMNCVSAARAIEEAAVRNDLVTAESGLPLLQAEVKKVMANLQRRIG